jgi:hypothetical protein
MAAVSGSLGAIMGVLDIIAVVGMAFDAGDVAGLNSQMGQDIVDMMGIKFLEAINANPVAIANNMHFPYEYLPSNTLEWQVAVKEQAPQLGDHMLEYLSALKVNSDGKNIRRAFTRPSDTTTGNDLGSSPTTKAQSYWWVAVIIGVVLLLIVGITVGILAAPKKPAAAAAPAAALAPAAIPRQ